MILSDFQKQTYGFNLTLNLYKIIVELEPYKEFTISEITGLFLKKIDLKKSEIDRQDLKKLKGRIIWNLPYFEENKMIEILRKKTRLNTNYILMKKC